MNTTFAMWRKTLSQLITMEDKKKNGTRWMFCPNGSSLLVTTGHINI